MGVGFKPQKKKRRRIGGGGGEKGHGGGGEGSSPTLWETPIWGVAMMKTMMTTVFRIGQRGG